MIVARAPLTFENIEIRPDFPVDFSPGDSVGFSYECHKFLQIPSSVHYMLGSDLAVVINVGFTLGAMQDLALAHTEQLVAICALVQIVSFLLQEQLELLHK